MSVLSVLNLGIVATIGGTVEAVIAASVNNPNVTAILTAAGWDGDAAEIVLTIDSGVKIGSASPATPSLIMPAFPAESVVTLVNNGKIMGAGGNGGAGAPIGGTALPGRPGGTALRVQSSVTIQNAGQVYGGGGGGGGSGWWSIKDDSVPGYSGGGGAGIVPGLTTEGQPYNSDWVGVGAGGGPGAPGTAGASDQGVGAAGGAAGFYIVGNNHVTWSVTGSRLGRVGS